MERRASRDGILGHQFDKRLRFLLHPIHSLSTGGFLKKTRLYSGFKNTYKTIVISIFEKGKMRVDNQTNTLV
jgi:hypothetical protein